MGLCRLFLGGSELDYLVFPRNRVRPGNRLMFIQFVIRPRPEICEFGKDEGNSFRLQNRVRIGHLKMKMRSGSLSGVAEASDHRSAGDVIA